MQNSDPEPLYIKVQYKHIIKKLKVIHINKICIDYIFLQFSQYLNGHQCHLHFQNTDNIPAPIVSDIQLQQAIANHSSNSCIRLYLTKTKAGNFQEKFPQKKIIQSKSQTLTMDRLSSSWNLYQSMIQSDDLRLRKISEDLVQSKKELLNIKEQKRQTKLSDLLSFV